MKYLGAVASFAALILLIPSGSLSLAAQDAAVPPQPVEIDGALSRVYKSVNGSELRLHVFNPQDRGTATAIPTIVFFFGGAWRSGTMVRAHATELGIDPNRIAAGGGSSGGHLALSTAVLDQFDEMNEDRRISSRPNALVLFNPAVDTTSVAAFGDRGRDGSPLHHIRPGLPPTLIVHGKADATVPYADGKWYRETLLEVDRFLVGIGYLRG